jgi:sensor histidine kinase YesM
LISEDQLEVEIRNSNPHLSKQDKTAGIGVENSRKRLDLIYSENYSLKIEDNKDEYLVYLNIPL